MVDSVRHRDSACRSRPRVKAEGIVGTCNTPRSCGAGSYKQLQLELSLLQWQISVYPRIFFFFFWLFSVYLGFSHVFTWIVKKSQAPLQEEEEESEASFSLGSYVLIFVDR